MAHGLRRMPLPPEMHSLKTEISCNQRFMSARQTEYAAIVSDALDDSSRAASTVCAADAGDELSFRYKQRKHYTLPCQPAVKLPDEIALRWLLRLVRLPKGSINHTCGICPGYPIPSTERRTRDNVRPILGLRRY